MRAALLKSCLLYQLAAVVRTGSEAAAAQALAGLVAVLQRAAITRDGSSGQYGQEEAALRAAQYGLAAAGARAAPQLLSLLEDATGKPQATDPHFVFAPRTNDFRFFLTPVHI